MANWSVSSVANNLDVLQAGLANDGTWTLKDSQGQKGAEFVEQANQVVQVARLMLQAMEDGAEPQGRRGVDRAGRPGGSAGRQSQGSDPGPWLPTVLKEAATHIASFGEKLGEYTNLLAQKQRLREQLKASAEQVIAGIDAAMPCRRS